jgi:hypothetical protein
MAEETQQQPAPEERPEGGPMQETAPEESQQPEPKYTDRDLDKYKGDARKEARRALLKDLGFEDAKDLKSFVEQNRQAQQAQKTEAEQKAEALAATEKERDEAYAYIAQMKQEQALTSALSEAGIKRERMKAAMRLVDEDLLDVDDDGNVTGVDDVVTALQNESPEWFGQAGRTAPDASPRTPPRFDPANMTDAEIQALQDQAMSGAVRINP